MRNFRTIRLAVVAAVAAVAVVAGLHGMAFGYTTHGGKWPQPGGKGTPLTITYSYFNLLESQNAPGQGLLMPNGQRLPDDLIRGSIEEAFGLWASVVPIHFVEIENNDITREYGAIQLTHGYINGPDPPPPALPTTKARASFPDFGGDIEYDNGDRWQEIGTIPVPDLLGATIHELGHSLGLNHSHDDDANMYWIFNRFSGLGTGSLHADDIAGIQSIYGAGVGSVTPVRGYTQRQPILPTSEGRNTFEFDNVKSGMWFDPPIVSRFDFVADSGTLFSAIAEFPSGFQTPFTLSVNGTLVGQFSGGENFSFQAFPGGGVSEFSISGIDPGVDADDPLGFPLRLAFTTATGSFSMLAVPEPGSLLLFAIAGAALSNVRRRRR